jgi:hypothetical protein
MQGRDLIVTFIRINKAYVRVLYLHNLIPDLISTSFDDLHRSPAASIEDGPEGHFRTSIAMSMDL